MCQTNPNEEECAKQKSLYYQYLKAGKFSDARYFWQKAPNFCEEKKLDTVYYINGLAIYNGLKKELDSNDSLKRRVYNDTMVFIFENLMELGVSPNLHLKYARFLFTEKYPEYEKMDSLFQNIHVLGPKTKASYMKIYFKHLVINHFNESEKEGRGESVKLIVHEYFRMSQYCRENLKSPDEKKRKSYQDVLRFFDRYFYQIITEFDLIEEQLTEDFNQLPDNEEIRMMELERLIRLIDYTEGQGTEIYRKMTHEMVNLKPTVEGYFNLGKLELSNNESQKAIESFTLAIELDSNTCDKCQYYLAQAYYQKGEYRNAFKTAKKVNGEFKGKAMIICGNAIASLANSCGDSSFERKSNYWLASDYYQRAIALGESVNLSSFSKKWPDKLDCFDNNVKEGDSVKCTCWNEFTTARTTK